MFGQGEKQVTFLLFNSSREPVQSSVSKNRHKITMARSVNISVALKIQTNKGWSRVIPNKSSDNPPPYSPHQCPVIPFSLTKCICHSTKAEQTHCSAEDYTKNCSPHSDLIKIFCCRPHFFPGLVQQLDADGKQLLKCTVMGEKHGVIVIPAFIGFRNKQKPQPCEHTAHKLLRASKIHYSDKKPMVYNSTYSKEMKTVQCFVSP